MCHALTFLNCLFLLSTVWESESLADYRRVLMQLQNRMVRAAASEAESAALVLLRDNSIKEQFVRVVREQSVRQELRWIIAFHSVG